jgi:SAM-dependent methyltransferase
MEGECRRRQRETTHGNDALKHPGTDAFDVLTELTRRPLPFSVHTTRHLWTDPHIARQMLRHHLDPQTPLASRRPGEIERIVDWLDGVLSLAGRRVCDLGCGPGLYAQQFHDRGATVLGVDWSELALEHARAQAAGSGRQIDYRSLDYLSDPLPADVDVFTLIYCDFCALSPAQRGALLGSIANALNPGGHLVMDVHSMTAFEQFAAGLEIERRMLDGFFAAGDYVAARQSLRYEAERATLERYLIVEPGTCWSIFNWLQYFDVDTLSRELDAAGFEIEIARGSLSGLPLTPASNLLAVVARAAWSAG